MPESIYQFKVTLNNIEPPVWRRIQVPEKYSFWDLHVAIQDAMGWLDYHLHMFVFKEGKKGIKAEIGIPDPDGMDWRKVLPCWEESMGDYFRVKGDSCVYEYDFGDGWEHTVVLEKILERKEKEDYPKCLAGRRACPPEDCGGPWGYEDLLKTLSNPDDEEYEGMIEWLGGGFDPESFDYSEVVFDDPRKRFEIAFNQ